MHGSADATEHGNIAVGRHPRQKAQTTSPADNQYGSLGLVAPNIQCPAGCCRFGIGMPTATCRMGRERAGLWNAVEGALAQYGH